MRLKVLPMFLLWNVLFALEETFQDFNSVYHKEYPWRLLNFGDIGG